MASIMQHMVSKTFDSVSGALDDSTSHKSDHTEDDEIDQARREAEERRREKHRKQEEEREQMRQDIRNKYGLKKRDKEAEEAKSLEGRLGRKKKPTTTEVEEEPIPEPKKEEEGIGARISSTVSEAADKCLIQ